MQNSMTDKVLALDLSQRPLTFGDADRIRRHLAFNNLAKVAPSVYCGAGQDAEDDNLHQCGNRNCPREKRLRASA